MAYAAVKIRQMLLEGKNYPTIIKELGVAGSTIAYHAKKMGLGKFTFERRVYNWKEIQDYYDRGYTVVDLTEKFGINQSTVNEAARRGDFQKADGNSLERKRAIKLTREATGRKRRMLDIDDIFVENSQYTTSAARNFIIRNDLLVYQCSNEKCQLHEKEVMEWAGEKLVLHLDHENGIRNDHRIENLRWLCPNCHSQTSTYCGRNVRKSVDETNLICDDESLLA